MPRRTADKIVAKTEPAKNLYTELGVSGLQRASNWGGTVSEEWLAELSGLRAIRKYREMRDNDYVVGAMFFAIEMLIRNVDWRVDGEDAESAEFVHSCMSDMSHAWSDFLAEILSMLTYGFSWHEIIYKRRVGEKNDPTQRSRFSDGKIGWRKIPIRAQDTLSEWRFDEDGGIQAFVQVAPPKYESVEIPIDRSLLFRVGVHKNNPEGRSLLRNAYRPWFFKKKIEEIEGIGIERDLAGIPVIWRSAELASQDAALKLIMRNLRRDEQDGLLLPLVYDESGRKLLEFELKSSPGTRQIQMSPVIARYDKAIAMTCLADFILLGQQAVGSFALADSKTAMFASSLGALLNGIADTINMHALPRLLGLNGIKLPPEKQPRIVPGDIESQNLQELGSYLTALTTAGMPLFPDEKLEAHLRAQANLPQKSEDSFATPKQKAKVPPAGPSGEAKEG